MRTFLAFFLLGAALYAQTPESAKLEAAVARNPGDVDSRTRLIRLYFQLARQDPSADHTKAKHILYLIQNTPDIEVLSDPASTLKSPSEDYDSIKTAWLTLVDQPGVKTAVLANAANFFRPSEPSRSIALLARAHRAEPANPTWTGMLGQMYAFQLTGVVGLNQNGLPIDVNAQKARSKETMDVSARLLASTDADLLGAVSAALAAQGMIASQMTGRRDDILNLARSFLVRAGEIEPSSARWPAMLAQSYATQSEFAPTSEATRLARLAMAQFDRAQAIDPDTASAIPPSKYARMAVLTGELSKARPAALKCLDQAPSIQVPDMAVHECNIILGRIALRQDDLKAAMATFSRQAAFWGSVARSQRSVPT